MAEQINEKYVKQTFEALSNSQLSTGVVAIQISQLPVREQIRFFKLAINYIETLAKHAERGYTNMGLENLAKACVELMEVVDIHFPLTVGNPPTGTEYVQI